MELGLAAIGSDHVLEPLYTFQRRFHGLRRNAAFDGRIFEAPLVVAADGGQSTLRNMAGIKTSGHDYGQTGLVTTIAHALPHDGIAYEHFRPAGPFASLPLPGNRSSLVWTERSDAARLTLSSGV